MCQDRSRLFIQEIHNGQQSVSNKNKSDRNPLISIGMPVFNGAGTLRESIRSIIMQSYTNWELLIMNDGSTDESMDIAGSFTDSRIKIVTGGENRGLSARMNQAVRMSRGELFARMDADDIAYPQRLFIQQSYLHNHPDIDLLAAATISFRRKGGVLGRLSVFCEHEHICTRPWNGFYMPHPTWMGKTAWFRQHRYETFADGAEDQDLLLRTYRVSRFACLKEPLLAYREGDRSLKKMLRTRRIFANAYIRQFMAERHYGMAIKVVGFLFLKSIADILNLLFGFARMRNELLPLSESEQSAWQMLWHGLESF